MAFAARAVHLRRSKSPYTRRSLARKSRSLTLEATTKSRRRTSAIPKPNGKFSPTKSATRRHLDIVATVRSLTRSRIARRLTDHLSQAVRSSAEDACLTSRRINPCFGRFATREDRQVRDVRTGPLLPSLPIAALTHLYTRIISTSVLLIHILAICTSHLFVFQASEKSLFHGPKVPRVKVFRSLHNAVQLSSERRASF